MVEEEENEHALKMDIRVGEFLCNHKREKK